MAIPVPLVKLPSRLLAWSNRIRVEHKVLAGFLIAFIFTGICAWQTFRNTAAYLDGYEQLFAIEQSIGTSQALITGVLDAQTAQRSYLLLGDDKQLAAYGDALSRIDDSAELLAQMLRSDNPLSGELPTLHALKNQQLAGLATAIALRRDRTLNLLQIEDFIHHDNENASRIRSLINRILIVQTADRFKVRDEQRKRAQRFMASFAWLGVAVIILIGLTYLLIHKQLNEKRVLVRRLAEESNHDPLTKLPNRVLLADWLEYSITQARQVDGQIAILYIDLDGFKPVNDRFGHQVGDTVLCEVARRFVNTARESDLIARVGGDEFVILLGTVNSVDDVGALASRLIESLNEPILPILYDQIVSASIGIALYPSDGQCAEDLLHQADQAMYLAKQSGRHQYRYARPGLEQQSSRQAVLLNDLSRALSRGELYLLYQPQMDIAMARVIGVETLIRWRHPSLGEISPVEFIPLAEASGLIMPIGAWVIRSACRQAALWKAEGAPPLVVAVNVAPSQLRGLELIDVIRDALEDNALTPQSLEIELTEGVLAQHSAAQAIAALKALGVRIAIDDFGTGYSSLNYLKRFAIDVIKIDQSFIAGVPHEVFDTTITTTIISVAKNLGMEVIAEGVENLDQVDFLRAHDCFHAQGYFFSKPIAADQILRYAHSGQHRLKLLGADRVA